jgi:hypothetical protein
MDNGKCNEVYKAGDTDKNPMNTGKYLLPLFLVRPSTSVREQSMLQGSKE